MLLLAGWAFTVLSVLHTALQAGERLWMFTLLIMTVVYLTILGFILINLEAQTSIIRAIEMAAYASVASSLLCSCSESY